MLQGINNNFNFPRQPIDFNQKMTDDQKVQLGNIISKYNPDNMNENDLANMLTEIMEAGITPGKEFGDIMNAAGFEPPAKPEGPPPRNINNAEPPAYLRDFVSKVLNSEVTDDDLITLVQNLNNSGMPVKGNIVDQKI